MAEDLKFKITWLSVFLAFLIQLVASVWFLSGLSAAVRANSAAITTIATEQKVRTSRVYQMDVFQEQIRTLKADIEDMRSDVKSLLRR